MPASFDDTLTITNGDINPKGPLGTLKGRGLDEVPSKVHLHFWISQQHGGKLGAFMQGQAMLDPTDSTKSTWVTRTPPDTVPKLDPVTHQQVLDSIGEPVVFELIHRHGPFKPGYAFAQAVVIIDPNELEWWATTILLEEENKSA